MVLQEAIAASDIGYSENCERFTVLTTVLSDLEYDYVQSVQPVFQKDLQFDMVDILGDLDRTQLVSALKD